MAGANLVNKYIQAAELWLKGISGTVKRVILIKWSKDHSNAYTQIRIISPVLACDAIDLVDKIK